MKSLTSYKNRISILNRFLSAALVIGAILLTSNEGWSQQRGKKVIVKKAPVVVKRAPIVVKKAPHHAAKPVTKSPKIVYNPGPRGRYAVNRGKWNGVVLLTLPTYHKHSAFDRLPIEVAVQIELQSLGYYHGSIDGDIGRGTIAAISSYQRANGLVTTGSIDQALLKSLNIID